MPFAQMAWTHGVLAEGAAALVAAFGWAAFQRVSPHDPARSLDAWATEASAFASWWAAHRPGALARSARV